MSTFLNKSKTMEKNTAASEEPENDVDESALHVFKDFLVIDTYENERYHSPKSNEQGDKKSREGSNKSLEKRFERNINVKQIGLRRDPEKTKRDIEKDKFTKTTQDIVKTLESGLMPPGMETDIVRSDSSKNELLANVPISSKDLGMKIDKQMKTRKEMMNRACFGVRKRPLDHERIYDHKQPCVEKYFTPTPQFRESYQWNSRQSKREYLSPDFMRLIDTRYKSDTINRFQRTFRPSKSPLKRPEPSFRKRSSFERSRSRRYSRSPVRAVFRSRHSREREDANCLRKPNSSRQRSTERFIQELIKTSGIQENPNLRTDSINEQPDYSDPGDPSSADIFAEFAPPIFPDGPPQLIGFPQYTVPPPMLEGHQVQPPPNVMLDDLSTAHKVGYYPNFADLQFNPVVPQFLPVQFPTFPPNVTPENPMCFPPPMLMEQQVNYNEDASLKTKKKNNRLLIDVPPVTEDSMKLRKLPRVEAKLKAEIINRCQEAVEKLENLHFPNRLIVPPNKHETLNNSQFIKSSPLRRQLPPSYSFTSKPNNTGAVILPSIISTIGFDEIIQSPYPVCNFSKLGRPMKDVSVQTYEFACDFCSIRKIATCKHTQTISARTYSVHSQVTSDDLLNSGTLFTPNQSAAPMQDKPVSLMHMTPAQILVAELAAKAKSFQRSTVEALQRAKLESAGNKDNGQSQPALKSSSASLNSGMTQQPIEQRNNESNNDEYGNTSRRSRYRPQKRGSRFTEQSTLSREYENFLRKIDYERQNSNLSHDYDEFGRNIPRN